jgi:hypothetical protein
LATETVNKGGLGTPMYLKIKNITQNDAGKNKHFLDV